MKLITKVVIHELQTILKELVLDKNGRHPLLQLLHPNCPRYFSRDDLTSLSLSILSLCTKGEYEVNSETNASKVGESGDKETKSEVEETAAEVDKSSSSGESLHLVDGGKKDPYLRRQELLVNSGLAEVATGDSDGILHPTLDDKIDALHEAIASLVAQPKSEDDHVLENFHSSRTIRKLVLDCPTFASTLWKSALEGKCEMCAQDHSCKVVCVFMESSDSNVHEMAKEELQPLINDGILRIPETKWLAKEA